MGYLDEVYSRSQEILLRATPGRAKSALDNTRLAFVVGMGRSGTTSVAALLNRVPECSFYHEFPADREALPKAYWDPSQAERYLSGHRERVIAARILRTGCEVYGDHFQSVMQ